MQDTKQLSVLEAIVTRRSIPQFQSTPVPREIIQRLLDAAVWVPNHRLTEPWQFFVLGEKSKSRFAEIRRDFRASLMPNPKAPEVQPALQKIVDDTIRTPVIIVVTAQGHDDPELREENYWATFGAAYAFMLGAWSLGIGTYFRTATFRDYPPLREFLGLGADRRIIGILYAGYPAAIPQKPRTPASEKTTWLD
jgi:nitroreductase